MEAFNLEDGGDMFFEMSSLTKATRRNNADDIRHCNRRENILEGSVFGLT
jgi:hypothetical protein